MLMVFNKSNVLSTLNTSNTRFDKKLGVLEETKQQNIIMPQKDYNKKDFNGKLLTLKKKHSIYEDQMKEIFDSNEKNLEKKMQLIDDQLSLQTNDIQERLKERRSSVTGFWEF